MPVETAAQIGHGMHRQAAHHQAMLLLQPVPESTHEIIAWRQRLMKGFRRCLDCSKMIGPSLEGLAHLVHRQPRARKRLHMPLPRQQVGEVLQARRLLAIGAIELDDTAGGIGGGFRHLDQLLLSGQFG
ncbi:hypothetical protein D9M70_595900 [compost metagenome]